MVRKTKDKYTPPRKHGVWMNVIICGGLLLAGTALSYLFIRQMSADEGISYLLFIQTIILICYFTDGCIYGIISSLFAVLCVNFFFAEPYFALDFTKPGYPVTFLVMLLLTLTVCGVTTHLRMQGQIIRENELKLAEADTEKMRANLLRAVSHDLRTPLTAIIGNTNNFLANYETLSKEAQLDLVYAVSSDADWLLDMVENLLAVTRIREDSLQIKTNPEAVEEVVAEALTRVKKRFPSVQIRASVPSEMIMIPMDAILIEQVILNLIENAILHSDSSDPIDLIVAEEERYISFLIKDYGNGIAPHMLEHLFESGSASYGGTDAKKGMGIGLSICKTIITAHHGEIYGENHSQGAQFCFLLPREEILHES